MPDALTRQIQELRLLLGSARDPEGRVFAQLGDALRRNGELDEAILVLREGVARHPHFTPGHLALAWAAQDSGDTREAAARFRRALTLDPENPFALFGLGTILAGQGDETGVRMVEQAFELLPRIRELAPSLHSESDGPVESNDADESYESYESEEFDAELDGDLDELPFMALDELEPELGDTLAEWDHLPFMSLASLSPDTEDEGTGVEGIEGMDGLDLLPFVSLSSLAPEPPRADLSTLPFRTLHELAPDPTPEDALSMEFALRPELEAEEEPLGVESAFDQEEGEPGAPDEAVGVEVDGFDDRPDSVEAEEPELEDAVPPAVEGGHQEAVSGEVERAVEDLAKEGMEEALAGEEEEDVDASPVTRTMAELFVRQGLLDRAVQMYESLASHQPGDASVLDRLEELRGLVGSGQDAAREEGDQAEEMPRDHAESVHPALSVPDPQPLGPSPYGWAGEGEEAQEPPPPESSAGAYFGRLLAWTPGNPAREADEASSPDPRREGDPGEP